MSRRRGGSRARSYTGPTRRYSSPDLALMSNLARELHQQPFHDDVVAVAARTFQIDIGLKQVIQNSFGARSADAFEICGERLDVERFDPCFGKCLARRLPLP